MPDLAVASEGLTKRFGSHVAVDGINLSVPRGSVFGFLGPNGSGKTTTIRMLLGLIRPTGGSVRVLDEPMPGAYLSVLARVGALVEGPAFHPYLSGRANLLRLDAMDATADPSSSRRRIDAALDRVGLTAAAAKKFRRYSLGMKQRLGIAAALLHPRELLILDEPTNGLDPQGTREIRTLVRELAADDVTVLVSTHLLGEVEQICSHAGIMHRGSLLATGTLAELGAGDTERVRIDAVYPQAAAALCDSLGLAGVEVSGSSVSAELGSMPPERLAEHLVGAGAGLRGFAVVRPSLEDTFVGLTGEGFDVAG